jgi:ABC-type polysaccharide/polyol phosphate export permease
LAALIAYYRIPVTPALAFLPVVVLVNIVFTAAVALVLSMANLFYRDVKYLFEVVITVWMFATSVVYPVELIGGRLGQVLALNPMTPIIDGYRAVLLRGQVPWTPGFAAAALSAVLILFAAWIAFHRSEFEFAENV